MRRSIPLREWQPDRALDGFDATTIALGVADDGPLVATLVRKKCAEPTGRAILYLHGFIDYFFQSHVAQAFNDRGWDFYALDLRRYGRSLKAGQRPNYIRMSPNTTWRSRRQSRLFATRIDTWCLR